jgi:hypothetical protein
MSYFGKNSHNNAASLASNSKSDFNRHVKKENYVRAGVAAVKMYTHQLMAFTYNFFATKDNKMSNNPLANTIVGSTQKAVGKRGAGLLARGISRLTGLLSKAESQANSKVNHAIDIFSGVDAQQNPAPSRLQQSKEGVKAFFGKGLSKLNTLTNIKVVKPPVKHTRAKTVKGSASESRERSAATRKPSLADEVRRKYNTSADSRRAGP